MKTLTKETKICQALLGEACQQPVTELLSSCDLETLQLYHSIPEEYQNMINSFLQGSAIFPINSNSFFRYMFMENTDYQILGDFISAILDQNIEIKGTWESEPVIKERNNIIYSDIVIQLENMQYADVELIKTGRNLSPRQLECIEADMLIRQYNRVKSIKRNFKLEHLRPMYLIVIADQSNSMFSTTHTAYSRQKTSKFSSGEVQNTLVNLHHISLDSFKNDKNCKNTYLDGWLTLLTSQDINEIYKITTAFPLLASFYSRYTALRNEPDKLIRYVDRMISDNERDRNILFRRDILSEKESWTKKFAAMQKNLEQKEMEINSLKQRLETESIQPEPEL